MLLPVKVNPFTRSLDRDDTRIKRVRKYGQCIACRVIENGQTQCRAFPHKHPSSTRQAGD